MNDVVVERTVEQRDFWKERAKLLEKQNAVLTAEVARLQKIFRDANTAAFTVPQRGGHE